MSSSKYDRPILAGFPLRQLEALIIAAHAGKDAVPKKDRASLGWALKRLDEALEWGLKEAVKREGEDHE